MNLYEIDNAILNCIDAETGEILDENALSSLEMEREKKIENIALWIKNLKSDAEALKAEKENFASRQKAAENRAGSLKEFLERYLNGEKYKSDKVVISYRKTTSVEIEDMSKLDDDYLRYKEPEPDKTKIKEALNSGIVLDGACLKTKMSMSIK